MKRLESYRMPMALITLHLFDNVEANFIVKNKSYYNIKKYISKMFKWNLYEMEVSELGLFEYVLLKEQVINLNNKID
tara:strand:+ start:586 stop:816 length:231 start_codon:yes stop_codon:yes gene_type:complete